MIVYAGFKITFLCFSLISFLQISKVYIKRKQNKIIQTNQYMRKMDFIFLEEMDIQKKNKCAWGLYLSLYTIFALPGSSGWQNSPTRTPNWKRG